MLGKTCIDYTVEEFTKYNIDYDNNNNAIGFYKDSGMFIKNVMKLANIVLKQEMKWIINVQNVSLIQEL